MGRKIPRRPLSDEFEMPDPDDETVASVVDQFGPGDLQIKVYKLDEGAKKYCATLSNPTEANEEFVRGLGYGAGKYMLHIVIDQVFKKAVPMAIAEKVGNHQERNENTQIFKMMMDRLDRMEQRIAAAPQREPLSELAAAMAQLHGIMPKPQEMTPDTILKWIDVGKELGGGGSGDSFTGMLKEIAPSILPALMRRNGGMAQHAPDTAAPPSESEAKMFLESRLRLGIAFLKKKCIAGADPLLYLDFIVDNRDEAEFQQLIHTALTSDFSAFVQIDPSINDKPFEPFFRAIHNGIRSAFGPDDTVADDTGGKGGDNGDAPSNGGSGKKRGK